MIPLFEQASLILLFGEDLNLGIVIGHKGYLFECVCDIGILRRFVMDLKYCSEWRVEIGEFI